MRRLELAAAIFSRVIKSANWTKMFPMPKKRVHGRIFMKPHRGGAQVKETPLRPAVRYSHGVRMEKSKITRSDPRSIPLLLIVLMVSALTASVVTRTFRIRAL